MLFMNDLNQTQSIAYKDGEPLPWLVNIDAITEQGVVGMTDTSGNEESFLLSFLASQSHQFISE